MSVTHIIAYVLSGALLMACGKKAEPSPDPAETAGAVNDALVASDAVGDAAADAGQAEEVDDEAARRQQILAQLAAAEVAGFERMRGELQGGFVTLQHTTREKNAKGSTVIIEATISFCDACKPESKADVESRKEQILAQYGELHAKNPSLSFDIAELELMPERKGVATYVKSYVAEGETRAAMHGLEVIYSDGVGVVRFFAYPQSPFPQSAEEHDAAMSRAELESAVRALFTGLWPILNPPRRDP
jgi:hypothetical protein